MVRNSVREQCCTFVLDDFIRWDLICFKLSEDGEEMGNLVLFCFNGRQDTRTLEMYWNVIVNTSYPQIPPVKKTLLKEESIGKPTVYTMGR